MVGTGVKHPDSGRRRRRRLTFVGVQFLLHLVHLLLVAASQRQRLLALLVSEFANQRVLVVVRDRCNTNNSEYSSTV